MGSYADSAYESYRKLRMVHMVIRIEEYARNMQMCIRYGLEQCDLVLADSGFIIEDSVGLYCAKVCIPPFTKGRKQLTKHEVDWSCDMYTYSCGAERVNGQLTKKYTVLQSVIPITLLKNKASGICPLGCIITICSVLLENTHTNVLERLRKK